jgi:hypothetical protein
MAWGEMALGKMAWGIDMAAVFLGAISGGMMH